MPVPWVLDEDDALELLAFLVTAARTQVEEAAEYGPMRLLSAAHRLAETIGPRASEGTRELHRRLVATDAAAGRAARGPR